MKTLRLPMLALAVLLTASDCNGEHITVPTPQPTAAYRTVLLPTPESFGVAARGAASAILYSDLQLVVNGTYQDFPGTVREVHLTFVGSPVCRLDHTATVAGKGTFSDTCTLGADAVLALDGGNASVVVFGHQFNEVLEGQLTKERTN